MVELYFVAVVRVVVVDLFVEVASKFAESGDVCLCGVCVLELLLKGIFCFVQRLAVVADGSSSSGVRQQDDFRTVQAPVGKVASRSQSLRKKCNRIVRSSGSKSMSSSKSLLVEFVFVGWL